MKAFALSCGLLLGFAGLATAQVKFSEVLVNPPGSPDLGWETIELVSDTANYNLNDVWVLGLEGDFAGSINPGQVGIALNLTGQSTGANKLLLIRDSVTNINNPAPAAETNILAQQAIFGFGIPNDSYTFVIVRGFSGALFQDLDIDDNGTLDVTPWTAVLDSFGWLDGDAGDQVYAGVLGGTQLPLTSQQQPDGGYWEPDAFIRFANGSWVAADVGGPRPGPYTPDPLETIRGGAVPTSFDRMTPGHPNQVDAVATPGDTDLSGCVDDADLTNIILDFGAAGGASSGFAGTDVNNDGIVDDADLTELILAFGSGC